MKKKKLLVIMAIVAISLTGCKAQNVDENTQVVNTIKETTVDIIQQKNINEAGIIEDETVYSSDDSESIEYFYVTVRRGVTGTETDHTFSEVNNVMKFEDDEHVNVEVKADALVQVGDETGPLSQMLGYGVTDNNATIEVRGNSTSREPEKSYTLKLNDDTSLWRGQKKIALVKSVYESARFRNKLFFDLLKDIPDVPSLRTQFVRVFIKDETSGEKAFTDYGLFTQIETPNKKYLKNHGLDNSGYLYKARSFNFETNDLIKNFDDPEFNLEEFEFVLSCSGKEDNTKLMEMIDAVNDPTKDIDTIIDTYFDRDNYLTWMAYNILMGNIDTTMQNFYLYSPLNGDTWYFIPWDGDGSLMNYEYKVKKIYNVSDWEKGISNYWGVILHQKFLSIEDNREQLTTKIELLKNEYLTQEKVTSLVQQYENTIGSYPVSMPDLLFLRVIRKQRTDIISKLYDEIEVNYTNYYETLEGLMPFFLEDTITDEGSVHFSWGESYDMKGDLVDYSFYLSSTPDFSKVIYEKNNIRVFSADVDGLKSGKYYWKVIATSEDGRTATAFNQIYANDEYYDGIESLVVK
jgi:spore coat protein H